MSLYSEENFIGKLRQLQDDQDSIPLVSHWMIYHRRYAKENVRTWFNELLKAPSKRKLVFIYLCNDVCQNSRRKGKEFIDTFRSIIKDAIVHSYRHSVQEIRKKIRRVLKVWEERKVFDSKVLGSIEIALDETDENCGTLDMEGDISPLPELSPMSTETPPLISSKPSEVEPSLNIPSKRAGAYDEDCRDPRLKQRKSEHTEPEARNANNKEVAEFCDISKLPEQLQTLYHLAMKAYRPTQGFASCEESTKPATQGLHSCAEIKESTELEDTYVNEISQQQVYINCLKDLVSLEEDRLFRMKECHEVQDRDSNHSVKDHIHLDVDIPTSFIDTCAQVDAINSGNLTPTPESPLGLFKCYKTDGLEYVVDEMTSVSTMDSTFGEGMDFSLVHLR